MTTTYKFKPWARLRGDPQKVGEEIESLRQAHGSISPAAVVDRARAEDSVLHDYFEWSDGTAAAKYREVQASHILRSIVVVCADGVEIQAPVRAFVSIRTAADESVDENPGTYTSIAEAVRVVDYRCQLMESAIRDLDAYRIKYQLLSGLTGWGAALEKARAVLQRAFDAAEKEAA